MTNSKENHTRIVNVGNLRLTYVPASERQADKNWSGHDVLRIQAYRDSKTKSLHRGSELPIRGAGDVLALIAGIVEACSGPVAP